MLGRRPGGSPRGARPRVPSDRRRGTIAASWRVQALFPSGADHIERCGAPAVGAGRSACAQAISTTAEPSRTPSADPPGPRRVGEGVGATSVCTGMRGASSRNSRASRRVRLATERTSARPTGCRRGSEGISDMWMPAHTTTPPFVERAQCRRHELAGGGEDDRRIELLRGRVQRAAGPSAPSPRAKACVASSPGRVKANTAGPESGPPARVCAPRSRTRRGRCARRRRPCQRPVADQPGAQQRCDLQVGVALGQREAVALVGDRQLRVAAVDVPPGEARAVTQVLAAAQAVAAAPARPAEPGDADARPDARRLAGARSSPRARSRSRRSGGRDDRRLGISTSPSSRCRSVRHTPQACTRARISPGPGSRLGELGRAQNTRPLEVCIARRPQHPRTAAAATGNPAPLDGIPPMARGPPGRQGPLKAGLPPGSRPG